MEKATKKKNSEKSEKAASPTKVAGKPEESVLATAMVRISPEKAEYVKMYNADNDTNGGKGWFVALGAPRVPELNKDMRLLLTSAVRHGCALFATEGGLRVMLSPTGKGGLCFITKKDATKGEELYLFKPATEELCKSLGLKVTRNSKGIYVAPRDTEGNIIFSKLKDNLGNNHRPMNFKIHPWDGHKIDMAEAAKMNEKAAKVVKKVSEDKKPAVNTKDGPDKKVVKVVAKKPEEGKVAAVTPLVPVKKTGKVVKKPVEVVGKQAAAG